MMVASPIIAKPKIVDQINGFRDLGKAQTTKSIGANAMEIQIKCIETNALVGGNQPQAPQKLCKLGIATLHNCDEPKTSKAVVKMAATSFINIKR